MRKPNYDQERAQRNRAKEEKAQLKAQKKLDQKAAEARAATQPDDAGAESDPRNGPATQD
ncbi:MAG TPA: hypothetical protein VIL69_12770 [Roseomonas sp.]|jgi:cell division protein FtsN